MWPHNENVDWYTDNLQEIIYSAHDRRNSTRLNQPVLSPRFIKTTMILMIRNVIIHKMQSRIQTHVEQYEMC